MKGDLLSINHWLRFWGSLSDLCEKAKYKRRPYATIAFVVETLQDEKETRYPPEATHFRMSPDELQYYCSCPITAVSPAISLQLFIS